MTPERLTLVFFPVHPCQICGTSGYLLYAELRRGLNHCQYRRLPPHNRPSPPAESPISIANLVEQRAHLGPLDLAASMKSEKERDKTPPPMSPASASQSPCRPSHP